MRKSAFLFILRKIVVLSLLAGTLFVPAGCSREGTDQPTGSTTVTGTIPTGPDQENVLKLESSELLSELLDFNWQDIRSVTLIKYRDGTKVSTVRIEDQDQLQSMEDLISKMSVIHASSDETAVPDENVVYEVYLDAQTSDDGSRKFLSIGPTYEDQNFAVGGTFIKAQSLTPIIPLLQTNSCVTFGDVQNLFDPMLDAK